MRGAESSSRSREPVPPPGTAMARSRASTSESTEHGLPASTDPGRQEEMGNARASSGLCPSLILLGEDKQIHRGSEPLSS